MTDNEITQIVGWPTEPQMAKFRAVAAAAAAAEREACVRVCEEWRAGCDNRSMQQEGWAAAECVQAIRQRDETLAPPRGCFMDELRGLYIGFAKRGDEIDRLTEALADAERRLDRIRDLLGVETECPCCQERTDCLEGCTFSDDDPAAFERMDMMREILL